MEPLGAAVSVASVISVVGRAAKVARLVQVGFVSQAEVHSLLETLKSDYIQAERLLRGPNFPVEVQDVLRQYTKSLEELQVLLLKVRPGKTGWKIRWALRRKDIKGLVSQLDELRRRVAGILRGPPSDKAASGFPDSGAATPGWPSHDEPTFVFPLALPEGPDVGFALEDLERHRVPEIPTGDTDGTRQGGRGTRPWREDLTGETSSQGGESRTADDGETEGGGGGGLSSDAEEPAPLGDLPPHVRPDARKARPQAAAWSLESWIAAAISTPIWVHGLYFGLGMLAVITCGMSLPPVEAGQTLFPVGPAPAVDPGFYGLVSQSAVSLLGTFTIIVPLARRDRKMHRDIPVSSPPSFRLFVWVAGVCAVGSGVLAAWSQKLATVVGFVGAAGQLVATLMLIQGSTNEITDRNRQIEELEVERMGWQRLWQASNMASQQVARPSALRVPAQGYERV